MIEAPAPLAAPVIDTHTHLDVHDRDLHGSDRPDVETLLALEGAVQTLDRLIDLLALLLEGVIAGLIAFEIGLHVVVDFTRE